MICFDASVAVKLLIPELYSEAADELYTDAVRLCELWTEDAELHKAVASQFPFVRLINSFVSPSRTHDPETEI